MSLIDLVTKKVTVLKTKTGRVLLDTSEELPESKKNNYKIPKSERAVNIGLSRLYVKSPKSFEFRKEVNSPSEFHYWLKVLLSKFPHYEFLQITRCSFSNGTKHYWLFDTVRKITVIMNEEEIEYRVITNQHN